MIDERPDRYVQPSIMAAPANIDMHDLSYNEYFSKVEEMIENLRHHWKQEQRVKALKIVIQLTKLLADTSQLKLYSKKFKMITNMLEEFGQLVHSRLQSILDEEHYNCDQALISSNSLWSTNKEKARELCANWFLKVASIRELVPRFYTEICILETCDIIFKSSPSANGLTQGQFYPQTLKRLTKAAWGFGDPIVALHARYYLCRMAERMIKWSYSESNDATLFELIMSNLEASAIFISQLNVATVVQTLHIQNMEVVVFFDLISGPLQSIINLMALRNDVYTDSDEIAEIARKRLEIMFDCLMVYVRKNDRSILGTFIILNSALRALPCDIIANHTQELLETIQATYANWKKCQDQDMYLRMITSTIYLTLESYGLSIDRSDVFGSQTDSKAKESILESVDSIREDLFYFESKTQDLVSTFYLRCFNAWVSYANHYIGYRRLSPMLDPFILRIKKNRQHANNSSSILDLIKALISNKKTIEEFRNIFQLKCFIQLLDLICKDDQKLYASEWILETMRASLKLNTHQETIALTDKVTINFMLHLFSTINDSLGLLSALDDIDHLSHLVVYFLEIISVQDYKEHLEFFSRCRGSLGNLNLALEYLAKRVLSLAREFRDHERKRSHRQNYLNGCLAYTFVTIPAINNPLTKLDLFLEGAHLALSHMSLSMADYYMKQALSTLDSLLTPYRTEYSKTTQEVLIKSSQFNISKNVSDRVQRLVSLVIGFEDNVDLKYKLILSKMVEDFYHDDTALMMSLRHLNLIDDADD